MRNEVVSVVLIRNGVVDESFLFIGSHKEISQLAERKFLDLCATCISNWGEYSVADIEAVLDDGYAEFGAGCVCLTWPEVCNQAESRVSVAQ